MMKLISVRFFQLIETLRSEGLSNVLKKAVFFNKEIIPAKKDLRTLQAIKQSHRTADLAFIEISKNAYKDVHARYSSINRRLRVTKNLKKGYRGFAIAREEEIIGDIWYCTQDVSSGSYRHPDLEWLEWVGIKLGDRDGYLFEMYVKDQERGGGVVNFLLWNALNSLKQKGYQSAFGYCPAHNIPALWVHRTLGYSELEHINMHRVFCATRRSIKGKNPHVLYRLFDLS